MKRVIWSIMYCLIFMFATFLFVTSLNAQTKENDIYRMMVHFKHPDFIAEGGASEYEFQFHSPHSIVIGNKILIKEFHSLIWKSIMEKESSKGISDSISIHIVLINLKGIEKNIYIDRKRNFQYINKKGKISQSNFKKLIEKCMSVINIIDLGYQEGFIWGLKQPLLCEENNKFPCR